MHVPRPVVVLAAALTLIAVLVAAMPRVPADLTARVPPQNIRSYVTRVPGGGVAILVSSVNAPNGLIITDVLSDTITGNQIDVLESGTLKATVHGGRSLANFRSGIAIQPGSTLSVQSAGGGPSTVTVTGYVW